MIDSMAAMGLSEQAKSGAQKPRSRRTAPATMGTELYSEGDDGYPAG